MDQHQRFALAVDLVIELDAVHVGIAGGDGCRGRGLWLAVTVIRMSELFRGGDTLMMYHYMVPRHSGDERPDRGSVRSSPTSRPAR